MTGRNSSSTVSGGSCTSRSGGMNPSSRPKTTGTRGNATRIRGASRVPARIVSPSRTVTSRPSISPSQQSCEKDIPLDGSASGRDDAHRVRPGVLERDRSAIVADLQAVVPHPLGQSAEVVCGGNSDVDTAETEGEPPAPGAPAGPA